MKNTYLLELNELAKRFEPPTAQLGPPPRGNIIESGQIWSTRAKPIFPITLPKLCKIDDPYFIVIIRSGMADMKGHLTHLAAPVLRNYLMAGPNDVILPENILCHRITVSLELAITILQDSLEECIGTLPIEWATNLSAYYNYIEGVIDKKPAVITGIEYLDENDVSYQCHKTMVKELAYLQDPVIAWAEECGVLTQPASLVNKVYKNIKKTVKDTLADIKSIIDSIHEWAALPAGLLPQLALARAAGGEPPRLDAIYHLPEDNAVLHLLIIEDVNKKSICQIKLFDQHGSLSEALDDSRVVGKGGECSAPIKGGEINIPLENIIKGFVILKPNNKEAKIQS